MTVKEIVGNIHNRTNIANYHQERVLFENESLAKRIHHVVTEEGNEISIRLAPGKHLHVGDILLERENTLVVVDVLPEDVLIIRPKTIKEMGEIAHELGNRHLPAQFDQNEMIVQYDYLIEQLLQNKKLTYQRESLCLKEPFRHIGHKHE